MVRFNVLKIIIPAGEAKAGGLIGATLSPYLFSANMADFCKKFNDYTKDIIVGFPLYVVIKCDVVEKTYSFFIKNPVLIVLYDQFRIAYNKYELYSFEILFLFDLVVMLSSFYGLSKRRACYMLFSYMWHNHNEIMIDLSAFNVAYKRK
jgi:hypothetical protein